MPKLKKGSFNLTKIIISLFAIVGIGIMAYLTYIHYANARSFCDISELVSCDIVTTSIYSEIFGIPISFMGLGYFLLMLLLIFLHKSKKVYQYIFFLTILMIVPSLYFSLVEIFVIKSICILCETSKALMFLILITSFLAYRKVSKVVLKEIGFLVFTGIVLGGVIFFMQTSNTTKADYSQFVSCLNEKGVVYYKSVKCNNCKRQERMLGQAYKKLNSIECHPEGSNPKVELCLEKRINKTPTFLLEKQGIEQKRLEGLQPLEKLASFAGCSLE